MTRLRFFVHGRARGQGSKRVITHRHTGKPALIESAGAGLRAWREDVKAQALRTRNGCAYAFPVPRDTPVSVYLDFILQRPASMPKGRVGPTTKPDIDKVTRACLDALTGVIYTDDAQVIELVATKDYGTPIGVAIDIEFTETPCPPTPSTPMPRRARSRGTAATA